MADQRQMLTWIEQAIRELEATTNRKPTPLAVQAWLQEKHQADLPLEQVQGNMQIVSEIMEEEREASAAIVEWARRSYEPVSSADDEMADMERAGLLPGMRVDLIKIEMVEGDLWKARLAIAGGRFDLIVTFWLDDIHQLQENRLHVESIEEAPGTEVPPLAN